MKLTIIPPLFLNDPELYHDDFLNFLAKSPIISSLSSEEIDIIQQYTI